jgi:hypothetical protein
MRNSSSPRPVTLAQAARALGLPASWLRSEADAGRIPCLIAGDRYLFDLEVLRDLIMERTRRGDGPPTKKEAGQ